MIPILFEKDTHAFSGNGLARLYDAFEVEVTEERNSIYELDMKYPVTGAHYDMITPGRIIVCTHDQTNTKEPFDIVSISRPIDGTITVHAVHISYRLTGVTVSGYDETVTTLEQAFNLFLAWADPYNEFRFTSDIATEAYMASADGTPRTVRQLMGGIEGSILDTWGGEWSYHEFNVRLNKRRGRDRKFRIRYGFNMTAYQEDTDYSNTYTSCVPYWSGTDEEGAEVSIVGSRVNYTATSYNGQDICIPLDLSDKFETAPTTEQLESMAYAYMNDNNADKPAQTIEVSFLQAHELGMEDYAQLLECELCDTVEVVFPYGNATGRYKIVRVVWDVLQDRYKEMTLGTLQTSLAEALGITNDLDKDSGGAFSPIITGDTGRVMWEAGRTDTNKGVGYGVGTNGQDRGVYLIDSWDTRGSTSWLIYQGTGGLAIKQPPIYSGHSTAVGTIHNGYNSSTVSLPSSTWKAICSLSLTAGRWLLCCGARFPSSASGRRSMNISNTSGADSTQLVQAPASGAVSQYRWTTYANPSTTTTYYINCWQNSGSTMTMPSSGEGWGTFITAIRIW